MRSETDTLGEVLIPDDALYGAQTQRAVENYPVSGLREHPDFIRERCARDRLRAQGRPRAAHSCPTQH